MKRAGVALVLASALAGTFAQTSAPASAAMPTLTLGRSEQVGPRTPMAEVGVRLVGELGRRAGVAFDFKPLPATRSLEAANAGEIDGNVGRTIDVLRRYPNLMAVPTPLGRLTMAIYGQTPDIATKSRAEIARMRVGVMRGVLTALKHSQGMQVNESTSFDSAFEMLASGHVDALLLEHVSAESYLKAHPNRRVHLWPHAWVEEPLYVVLHRKHAALVPPLDAAMVRIRREGLPQRYYAEALAASGIAELPP